MSTEAEIVNVAAAPSLLNSEGFALFKQEAIDFYGEPYVDSNEYDDAKRLIIHYPKLTISNRGASHVLFDLYVKIYIKNPGHGIPVITIAGLRATASLGELTVGYRHSHLPTGARIMNKYSSLDAYTGRFESFCLGSNQPIHSAIEGLQYNLNNFTARSFFEILHVMLKWESAEGGPYIRMSHILNASRPSVTYGDRMGRLSLLPLYELIAYKYIELLPINDINLIIKSGTIEEAMVRLDNDLLELAALKVIYENNLINLTPTLGLVPTTNHDLIRYINESSTFVLSFKGNKIYFKTFATYEEDRTHVNMRDFFNKANKKHILTLIETLLKYGAQ